ncbi:hypothetical protein [Aquibacillus albus]|uniref:General stress protein 17M-like domain-containing protein n=1 Tax=Aquibacillus albus TaxID=1168171 RepID=A0ABS2N3Y6_9BACI|nr:hypothetical protein [Aquibacillus albus]MBM7572625.1 hypothetical protein [Aquibacillus albus]
MATHILAYFKNENDAEAVHADLHRLHVNNVVVDEMPEDAEPEMIVPIAAVNTGSGGAAVTNNGFFAAAYGQLDLDDIGDDAEDRRKHLLEFDVEDEDVDAAIEILKKHDGYIDKSLLQ